MTAEAAAPGRLEHLFVVVAFVLFSGALLPLLRPEDSLNQVSGDPLSQAIWLSIYLLTLILSLRNVGAMLGVVRQNPLLVIVLAFVLASTYWSYAPDVTLRKSLGFLGSTVFAFYVAQRFSFEQLMRLVAAFLAVSLLGSLVLVVAVPSLGIDQLTHAGSWRGLYEHKNEAGRMMVFGTLAFALQAVVLPAGRGRQLRILGGLGCFAFLLLTTSKTALLSVCLIGALLLAARLLCLELSLLLALVLGGGLALTLGVGYLASHADQMATMLGRDLTLTGRTGIWEAVFDNLKNRLWLGYGYEAFWLGEAGDSAYVWRLTNYHATFSHNGFLEVWLDIGLAGLSVVVLHLTDGLRRAVVLYRRTRDPAMLWFLFFLAFTLFYNASEAFLLKQNNFFWILYCISAAQLWAHRPQRVPRAIPTSFSPPELSPA